MLKITQMRSGIRRTRDHKDTLRALGLKRPYQSVYHEDTPTIRGMVNKIGYLLEVTEVESVDESEAAEDVEDEE